VPALRRTEQVAMMARESVVLTPREIEVTLIALRMYAARLRHFGDDQIPIPTTPKNAYQLLADEVIAVHDEVKAFSDRFSGHRLEVYVGDVEA
jgi:hypothetical protein